MQKPCSLELRERVVGAVESGASRREAADWFEVSPSSAIKWMQRRRATGSYAPKPSGGTISPLEAHAAFLFALIARQAGLTLDEIVAGDAQAKDRRQSQRGMALLSTAQNQRQKKACGRQSKGGPTWRAHGDAGCESKACLTQPDWYFSTRPRPRLTWCGFAAAVGVGSD